MLFTIFQSIAIKSSNALADSLGDRTLSLRHCLDMLKESGVLSTWKSLTFVKIIEPFRENPLVCYDDTFNMESLEVNLR